MAFGGATKVSEPTFPYVAEILDYAQDVRALTGREIRTVLQTLLKGGLEPNEIRDWAFAAAVEVWLLAGAQVSSFDEAAEFVAGIAMKYGRED